MSYLVQQLWTTLLIAFVIGAVFGWLLKSWLAVRLQTALKDAGARQDALQAEASRLREELKDSRERQRRNEAELQSARSSTSVETTGASQPDPAMATELLQLNAELAIRQARILALEEQQVDTGAMLAARLGESAVLKVELEKLRASLLQEQRARTALEEAAQQSLELTTHLQQQHLQLTQALSATTEPRSNADPDQQPATALLQVQAELLASVQDNARLRAELEQTCGTLDELRQLLPAAAPHLAPQTTSPLAAGSPDDLQLIRGVGPKIARRLQELGVYSFRQIALADPAELDRLARSLPGFASRIGREDWPGQCARLHRDKYGAAP